MEFVYPRAASIFFLKFKPQIFFSKFLGTPWVLIVFGGGRPRGEIWGFFGFLGG